MGNRTKSTFVNCQIIMAKLRLLRYIEENTRIYTNYIAYYIFNKNVDMWQNSLVFCEYT